jgi:hypothetical protein
VGEPVNINDRLYFQQANSNNDFATREFQIGIINKPTFHFGYHDEAGQVREWFMWRWI